MHTYVSDSTAATRKLKKCYVSDSGGATRYVKKIWVADSGGVSRLVFESLSVFTMHAGIGTSTGITLEGYSVPLAFGSLTPAADVNGNAVQALFQSIRAGLIIYEVSISSNPGQSYFTTLAVAGQGTFLSSAASYSYSSGLAEWQWPVGGTSFTNGNTYTITVSL